MTPDQPNAEPMQPTLSRYPWLRAVAAHALGWLVLLLGILMGWWWFPRTPVWSFLPRGVCALTLLMPFFLAGMTVGWLIERGGVWHGLLFAAGVGAFVKALCPLIVFLITAEGSQDWDWVNREAAIAFCLAAAGSFVPPLLRRRLRSPDQRTR